jgi:ABC-type dipeptide/oligopeptide/nickel transport system ATPase component
MLLTRDWLLTDTPASRRQEHPYTRGLLECMPALTHPKARLPVMARDPSWIYG